MKEVKQAINGYTKPIEKLLELIKDEAASSALDVIAVCKQVEELSDSIARSLVAQANAEYMDKLKKDPAGKQFDILAGEALVSKYGAKGTWIYSKAVIADEAALKAKMKEEQVSKVARKLMPKEDPERIAMYAITLKPMPIVPQAKASPEANG